MTFSILVIVIIIIPTAYLFWLYFDWKKKQNIKMKDHAIDKFVEQYQLNQQKPKLDKLNNVKNRKNIVKSQDYEHPKTLDNPESKVKFVSKQNTKNTFLENISAEDRYLIDAYLTNNKKIELVTKNNRNDGFCIKDKQTGLVIYISKNLLKESKKKMIIIELKKIHKQYWSNKSAEI